jgi:hypothetical protein
MDQGRIIEGIKYLRLCNNYNSTSLEDAVYFTLRDIFVNISGLDYCIEANAFNRRLTNDVSLEERTDDFQYSDALYDKYFVEELHKWLSHINKWEFDFDTCLEKDADEEEIALFYDMTRLIKFEDWYDPSSS